MGDTVVFASSNDGKIRELNTLMEPLGYLIQSQKLFGIETPEETGLTFIENALLKARHASTISGLPAIADDSGLEVDALHGAPGLYSSRYASLHQAGEGDQANNELLLKQLASVTQESQRSARFRTVLVFLRTPDDPAPLIAQGTWEGHILKQAAGTDGFGYDPIFCNHDTHTAVALLSKKAKNELSHRGKAVRALLEQLSASRLKTHGNGLR